MRIIYDLYAEITAIDNLEYRRLGFLFHYNLLVIVCFIRNHPKDVLYDD